MAPAWDNVGGPSAPAAPGYASPLVDFSPLSRLGSQFFEGAEAKRKYDIARAFEGGLPKDSQGNIDFRAVAESLAQKGGIDQIVPLANVDLQRQGLALGQGAAGAIAGGDTALPAASVPPRAPVAAPPVPRPSAGYSGGDNGQNTVASIVIGALGEGGKDTGRTMLALSSQYGVDPNQPLNVAQAAAIERDVAAKTGAKAAPPIDRYAGTIPPAVAPTAGAGPVPVPAVPTAATGQPGAIADPTLGGLVPPKFIEKYGPQAAAGQYVRWLRGTAVGLGAAGQKGAEDAYNKQADAIATALQKASEPTPEMKNAIASGAASPLELKGQEAVSGEAHKAIGADVAEYIKAARPAQQRIQMLNTVGNALKAGEGNITTGPFADVVLKAKQGISSAFGVDLAGVPESEVAQKTGLQLATLAVKEISNRPTQFEFKVAMENNPGLLLSPKGSGFMIDIMKQSSRQQIDLAKLAQKKENWGDWQNVVDKYYLDHPLISPFTGKPVGIKDVEELQKAAGAAPAAGTAKPAAPMQFNSPTDLDAAIKAKKVQPGDVVKVPGGTVTIRQQ